MEPLTTKEIVTIILVIVGATYIVWRFRLLGLLAAITMAMPAVSPILIILVVLAIIEKLFRFDK
jgi:hypothetical protein